MFGNQRLFRLIFFSFFLEVSMTTKEKIINAGFRQLLKMPFDSISLNEIAKNVGISKPAIYKHFKSKNEVLAEMRAYFFEELGSCFHSNNVTFSNISEKNFFSQKESVSFINFFCEHLGYLNYFIRELSCDPNFELSMQMFFVKENLIDAETFHSEIKKIYSSKNDLYLKIVYSISTINCFISGMHSFSGKNDKPFSEKFSENLFEFVSCGWKSLNKIPEKRMEELEKIAALSKNVLEPTSKFFDAVADIVKDYGFPGLTVERIASKMGLATSTLYTHYDNKSDLIQKVVFDEIKNLITQCSDAISSINDFSEFVYIQIQSIAMYLFSRPSALPVFKWLRSKNNQIGKDIFNVIKNLFLNLNERKKELILTEEKYKDFPEEVFVIWIHTVPISIIGQGYAHGFSEKEIIEAIRRVYGYMVSGVKNE